ncbi:MAG: DNA double-strand break repair nuclease NurA [Candidatus Thermochlorobacter sp.]
MLQLHRVQSNLSDFAERLQNRALEKERATKRFYDVLLAQPKLHFRYKENMVSHKVASIPIEEPALKKDLPERPASLILCATDGSQIFSDRHLNADFFLLNISRIIFYIGTTQKPTLQSHPQLYDVYQFEQDLTPENEDEPLISPEFVSALRQEEELRHLLDAASHARQEKNPLLALIDGTLICWHLKRLKPQTLQDAFTERYVQLLGKFRQQHLALASYISFPSSKEVVNLLQVLLQQELAAAQVEVPKNYDDAEFFAGYLSKGQRSAIFASRSESLKYYEEADRIYFFYLHTGREIARVEFPKWCYDLDMIDFIHATLFDDLEKGGGYPMTLTEAHEQAVVKSSEQEEFYRLFERLCMAKGYRLNYSAKSLSKRIAKL